MLLNAKSTVNIYIYDEAVMNYVQQLIVEGKAKQQSQDMLISCDGETLFFRDGCLVAQMWMHNLWHYMHYFGFTDGDFDPVINYGCGYNSTKQHEDYLNTLQRIGSALQFFFQEAGELYKLCKQAVQNKRVEVEFCPDGFEFYGTVAPEPFCIIGRKLFYYKGSVDTTHQVPVGIQEICNDAFALEKKREYTSWDKEIKNLSRISRVIFPESLTKIGDRAFFKCDLEGELSFPEAVTAIGDSAFEGCKLKKVVIGSKVKKIGKSAFSGMATLESVVISSSVAKIGAKAFDVCPNLTICAPTGSSAETYAKENGIPFVPV